MTDPNTTVKETRIPSILSKNPIMVDFCRQFLSIFDEITGYNKDVLAEKDSEWTAAKVLQESKKLGRPEDANVPANEEIKAALEAYENAVTVLSQARRATIDITSKVLGISLAAVADRDPTLEAPLKERYKYAVELGTQLSTIAKMLTDPKLSDGVTEFLAAFPLPAIGRDQVRTFGSNEKATPKYRVHVSVSKDKVELISADGFTKAGLALTKPALGYPRGQARTSDDLRKAWEGAGNTPETTVTNPVEFDDNNLHYVITKK